MKKVKLILTLTFGIIGVAYLAIAAVMSAVMQNAFLPDADLPVLAAVFGGMGALFIVLTFFIRYLMDRGERKRQELLSWGQRIAATVVEVRPNYSVKFNRRHPWVVYAECVHPITREQVTLHSHLVWACTLSPGQKVDIVFDRMDEKKFAFDIPEEEGKP